MPRWVANTLHILNILAGFTALAKGIVPVKYIPAVAVANVTVSGIIGNIQHVYNTDGTPQQAPFVPPK